MRLTILYLSTAAIFLVLDAIMLSTVMAPLFERHIGALMLDSPRMLPAGLFYLGYVAGLAWLVSLPALRAGRAGEALVKGAVVGAMAYGTYEFTSYAILTDWHITMLLTDTIWGTALTAISAWGGVRITERLVKGARLR